MLKRKVKQFVSLLTTLALTGTFFLGTAAPAHAIENIKLGEPGYVSLHSYTTPTSIDGVYKVKLTMDVNTLIEPADIVFVIDNSGSMGYPAEDEYTDPATGSKVTLNSDLVAWGAANTPTGVPTSAMPTPFSSMSAPGGAFDTVYGWDNTADAGDPTSGQRLFGIGAWKWGAEHDQQLLQNVAIGESLMFANPDNSTILNGEGYRFEWMKEGLMEAIEMLLDPVKNGTAELNQVSVFAFGDGSTETDGTSNNLTMKPMATGTWDAYDPTAYNWAYPTVAGSAGHVWANNYNLNGVEFNVQPAFTTTDYITFNSNMLTGSTASIDTPTNASWATKDNYKTLLKAIDEKLVRRQEGTGTAAGLQAAYQIFTDPAVTKTRANAKKYVFVLTDGCEFTNRAGTTMPANYSYTESIATAANLKQLGVSMTGCGILEPDSSVFQDNRFVPSQHKSLGTANPAPTSILDYIGQAPEPAPSQQTDLYAGEQHLLRILMPLKPSSTYMKSKYSTSTPIKGSDFWMKYTNDASFGVESGTGYGDYVNAITTGGDADLAKLNYYRANTKAGVMNAFREFVKSIYAASEISPEIKLGQYFSVYQMAGQPLFDATNGSATGGGQSISWSIPDIGATGGSASLTFYVKLDAPADQSNVWQGLLSSFMVKYRDFHGDLVSKGIPQNYIEAPKVEQEVKEIDHRLDDSAYAVYTNKRKTEVAAFITPFSQSGCIEITDVKAEAKGSGKVKLSLTAPNSSGLYYQWQYLDTKTNEWISILGANSSVFTVTGLKPGTYTFRCAVRNATSSYTFSKEVQVTLTAKDCK